MLVAGVIEDTLSAAGELELVSTQLVVVARVTTAVRSRGLSRQFFLVSVSATASVSATVSVSVKSVSVRQKCQISVSVRQKKPGD